MFWLVMVGLVATYLIGFWLFPWTQRLPGIGNYKADDVLGFSVVWPFMIIFVLLQSSYTTSKKEDGKE